MNKILYSKTAKGIVSLVTIVILLSSILTGSLFYGNNITANVVQETSSSKLQIPLFAEIDSINELKYLNEGWYELRNGYVFYLESFDSYVPLYIKVKNPSGFNGLVVVDADGTIKFTDYDSEPVEIQKYGEQESQNLITGEVTGLEIVSGMVPAGQPSTYQELLDNVMGKTSEDFILSSHSIASSLSIDHEELLRTMWRETSGTFNPAEPNRAGSNAIGLIQFTPSTIETLARRLNKNTQDFPRGNAVEQLSWVEEYFKYKRDVEKVDITRRGELHLAVFAPAAVNQPNTFVAYTRGTQEYELNKNVDIDGNGQITKGEIDDFYIRGLSAPSGPPPLPAGFSSTSTSSTTNLPALPFDSKNSNYPVGRAFQTADGVYAKNSQGAFIKLVNNQWQSVNFNWDITINNNGKTEIITVPAQTANDARAQAAGLNIIGQPTLSLGNVQASTSGQWEPGPDIGDRQTIIKGNQRLLVPSGTTQNDFLRTERSKDDILNRYQQWIKSNNIPPDEQSKRDFIVLIGNAEFDNGLDLDLVAKTLGVTNLQGPSQQNQLLPRQLIGLTGEPINIWVLPDGSRTSDENKVNLVRQQVLADQALKTLGGQPYGVQPDGIRLATKNGKIYRFNGDNSFVELESGEKYTLNKKIAGTDYPITFTIDQNGKSIVTGITLDNKDVSITPQQYDLMQKYGQNGYKPSYDDTNKNFVFTREYESKEDKQGRKTKTKDVFTLDNAGGYSTTTQETIDREGKTIGLKEIRYTKLWNIETTYTVKDGSVSYQDYIESRTDPLTGKPIQYTFTKDNVRYTIDYERDKALIDGRLYDLDKLPAEIPDDVKKALNQNKNNRKDWSSRKFFANLERVFTEYRGLGYIPGLFMDEKRLLEWRRDVDKFFTENYLGIEAWTSKICEEKIEHGQSAGVAYAETPQGLAQIGAHIEATRTQPIVNLSQEMTYIYKITFNVRNGDYEKDVRAPENMSINVFIKKEDGSSIKLFKKGINIGRGASFGKMGSNAIVKETKNYYTRICIKFDQIPVKWKVDNNEICNIIQESPTEPTAIRTQAEQQRQQRTEGELEDF